MCKLFCIGDTSSFPKYQSIKVFLVFFCEWTFCNKQICTISSGGSFCPLLYMHAFIFSSVNVDFFINFKMFLRTMTYVEMVQASSKEAS